MAFVHHEFQECTKSEIDLFTIPATQTSTTKGQWIEYNPLSNITDTGPIEFNVSGTGKEHLELPKTKLFVKAKITKLKRCQPRPKHADRHHESISTFPVFFERATDFPVDQYPPISCHD